MFMGMGWPGHRRLAILDVSPAGHQPMHDEDTGNWITFNGEIYNFREIRRELESRNELFCTGTDTEVILKAYRVWGKDCLKRLRGIFAFGIWDAARQYLFLARDQLGVKPLYIYHKGETLLFASEVRAILASGLVLRSLYPDGLISYLAYGSVQEPFTLVCGIRSLLAGHFAEWREGVLHDPVRYWKLPSPGAVMAQDPITLNETLATHLAEAVESQLVSDVPLGVFLSGGIDSTAITALMKRAKCETVNSFSIVFEEKVYDERYWSRLAAQQIGTVHTELMLSGEEVHHQLPGALEAIDQPSMDGLNTYFVSKAVRNNGLTVALSGVGGDELFGGYDGYRKALMAERYQKLPRLMPNVVTGLLAGLLGHYAPNETLRKVADFLVSKQHPYFITRRLFSDSQIQRLLTRDMPRSSTWRHEAFDSIEREAQGYDPINRASAFELQTYMRSTLLRDTDQMSMAHALEVRVPLIDRRLVEFLFTLPGRYKLDGTQAKPLLTRSLSGLIPQEIVFRPKQGFELPFQVWLQRSLQEEMQDIFLGKGSDTCLETSALAGLWDQFQSHRVGWSRVWALFMLEHWIRRHGLFQ